MIAKITQPIQGKGFSVSDITSDCIVIAKRYNVYRVWVAAISRKREIISRAMDFEMKIARYFEGQGYAVRNTSKLPENSHYADMVLTQIDGAELLIECKYKHEKPNVNRRIKQRHMRMWGSMGIDLVGEKEFEDGYVLFGRKTNNKSTEEE